MTFALPDVALSQTMTTLSTLTRHNARLMLREPGPVIGRQAGTVQVVTGMLVMFSLLALSVVGTGIRTERSWRTWDRLRATPARAAELLAAKALPAFALLVVLQAARTPRSRLL